MHFLISNFASAIDRAHMKELLFDAKCHDAMTGLYNTDGFLKKGSELIHRFSPTNYTAFYFNLTNFKYVNKATSYHGGDLVLIKYAKILTEYIEDDESVGRLGGDNFAILLKNNRVDEFIKLISNIEISLDFEGELHTFIFSAVCGGFVLDADVDEFGRVMMGISAAYQIAKEEQHQSLVYCTQDMFLKLVEGKEILMKFPNALANNEFLVYYQPKVDSRTNELVGAEALVRWRRGSEVIPPFAFIPMLERNGEICNLDFYVFETVCHNMRTWIDDGRTIPTISSNFSRWHLQNEDFVNNIVRIADKYHIDHKYLEIEITETTDVNEYKTLLRAVNALKKNGFSISIDDFGTGYSSLNMLKEISVDVLKLDKSLIDRCSNSKKDKIMLKHIVNLADDMSIKTLAEGVETIEQLKFLKSIGCNLIQGYFYDKPLMQIDFENRIKRHYYEII